MLVMYICTVMTMLQVALRKKDVLLPYPAFATYVVHCFCRKEGKNDPF